MAEKASSQVMMFVDIPGASEVREKESGDAARDFVQRCIAIIGDVVASQGGSVVRTIGSAVLCAFTEPDPAIDAACAMHDGVLNSTIGNIGTRVLRTGVHRGRVTINEGAYSGEAVTAVARMVTAARPHQILITGDVFASASAANQARVKPLANAGPLESRLNVKLYEVAWRRDEGSGGPGKQAAGKAAGGAELESNESLKRMTTSFSVRKADAGESEAHADDAGLDLSPVVKTLTPSTAGKPDKPPTKELARAAPLASAAAAPAPSAPAVPTSAPAAAPRREAAAAPGGVVATLRLAFRGKVLFVDPHRPIVFMGRDAKNDIPVDLDTVSRRHAEVEFRQGEFYVVDHSWNGTFVYDDKGTETVVHNSEQRLGPRGMICPGCPGYVPDAEAIVFHRDV